jgi:hypothetical protein
VWLGELICDPSLSPLPLYTTNEKGGRFTKNQDNEDMTKLAMMTKNLK